MTEANRSGGAVATSGKMASFAALGGGIMLMGQGKAAIGEGTLVRATPTRFSRP